MEVKKWEGKLGGCDFCKRDLNDCTFVDGKTVYGPWALMCPDCFRRLGVGLGVGKGQAYDGPSKVQI